MRKYDPLAEYLRTAPHPVEMTFAQVAALVGGLPASAFRWPAWWANSRSHVLALGWLDEGRSVESFDLTARRVRFN